MVFSVGAGRVEFEVTPLLL